MALKEYDFQAEPTVTIVKKILNDAIIMKATDIHFDPRPNDLSIKFRINGELTEYTVAPESVKSNITTRMKILAGMNITESTIPQVGAINYEYTNNNYNMRVSTLPIVDGEKVVAHLSNYAHNLKGIDKLGINPQNLLKIKDLLKEKTGIILITGTTGSGKTTTLYSILKEFNNKIENIISIEDPIKMKIPGINQVQINPEKGLTLKNILKNILLQDPNIISISELHDDETTRSAIRASITGRLVISSMQTKNVYTTIDTLLNMEVENYLLGSYLTGVISERLVKRLCPSCKASRAATDYEKNIIRHILKQDIELVYEPVGCDECQNGYIDQIPLTEVVKIDNELREAISNNKDRNLLRELIYTSNDSILKDGFQQVLNGETSFEEVIRITDIKTDFSDNEKEIKDLILGNKNDIISSKPSTSPSPKTEKVEKAEKAMKDLTKSIKSKINKESIKDKEESQSKENIANIINKAQEITEKIESPSKGKKEEQSSTTIEDITEDNEPEKPFSSETQEDEIIKITADNDDNADDDNNDEQTSNEADENATTIDSTEESNPDTDEDDIDIDDDDNFDYGDSYINNF